MQVKNGILLTDAGSPVRFVRTPNEGQGSIVPLFLIMHYTAGLSLEGSLSWLSAKTTEASAHIVIGRDGAIVQMVRFDRRAWHAGRSQWGTLKNMNGYAIGIELDNAGQLERRADGRYHFKSLSGEKIMPDKEVAIAKHKNQSFESGWHTFTPVQLQAAVMVGQVLNQRYRFQDVLGHDDVSPGHKIDPGPNFPMNGFRSQVLGRM